MVFYLTHTIRGVLISWRVLFIEINVEYFPLDDNWARSLVSVSMYVYFGLCMWVRAFLASPLYLSRSPMQSMESMLPLVNTISHPTFGWQCIYTDLEQLLRPSETNRASVAAEHDKERASSSKALFGIRHRK